MNSLRIGDLGFVTACYESSACQRIKEIGFFSLEDTIQLEQRHKEMHMRFSLVRREVADLSETIHKLDFVLISSD